jgi:hypothetical protein
LQVGNFNVAKSSKPSTSSQDVNSQNADAKNTKRDEVLKRMLKMKPQPHVKPDVSQQLNFADSKDYSDTNISKGNKR